MGRPALLGSHPRGPQYRGVQVPLFWVGGDLARIFHVKGGRETKLLRRISQDFGWNIPGVPEKSQKDVCVLFSLQKNNRERANHAP